ncbi:hypothetical protein VTN77DRAFT_3047 [Rasamsonia byssochlamydoides]|uniref:uncharacterized protein n=1 Tax=Rasamsonia byssochlamydoides TaxID=89139 RepID=UPI00374279FD
MRSQRRTRLYLIAILAIVFVLLYATNDAGGIQNHKFYKTTVEAMDRAREAAAAKKAATNDNAHIQKLDPGAVAADEKVLRVKQENVDTASKHKSEEMEEIFVAGRAKMQVPKQREDQKPTAEPKKPQETDTASKEETEAKTELNAILKRSPIIIFSKSYCPYSARAKSILLNHYSIVPEPYVVELDLHPLGPQLQQLLAENTGRRTVPNILVNGRSIGGGDDVAALDRDDELASKIKSLGGKRIMEVSRKSETGAKAQ